MRAAGATGYRIAITPSLQAMRKTGKMDSGMQVLNTSPYGLLFPAMYFSILGVNAWIRKIHARRVG